MRIAYVLIFLTENVQNMAKIGRFFLFVGRAVALMTLPLHPHDHSSSFAIQRDFPSERFGKKKWPKYGTAQCNIATSQDFNNAILQ